MYYIFFDDIEGIILGLSDVERLDVDNNWVSLSEEAYNFILDNNGQYIVDLDSIQDKIEIYKEEINKLKENQIETINYIVVEKNNLKLPETKLKNVILNKIKKNNSYCQMFIENGVVYTFEDGTKKQYTYKIEDQINFLEIRNLYNEGILITDNKIPLKAKDENEYDLLPISTVIDIHNKLIKNKHYNLFFLYQLNEYVSTLTSLNDINRLQYETILPEKYQNIIKEQMEPYNNL